MPRSRPRSAGERRAEAVVVLPQRPTDRSEEDIVDRAADLIRGLLEQRERHLDDVEVAIETATLERR